MNKDVGEGGDVDMIPAKGYFQSLCSLHCYSQTSKHSHQKPRRGEKTERQITENLRQYKL